MKKFFLGIALVGGLFGSTSNPKQGFKHYEDGKYAEAATFYENALIEYADQRPLLNFNLGQCNLRMDSTIKALGFFSQATNMGRRDAKLTSLAWNQIGGIHASTQPQAPNPGPAQPQGSGKDQKEPNPLEIALEDFKNALRMDSDNELARFNYELLKRKLEQQQQQQQDQKDENKDQNEDQKQDQEQKNPEDQDKQDQQDQNKKDQQEQNKPDNEENKGNQGKNQQEGEPSEQKMSMEQAKALLEAMNQNEKMFLQQLQKDKQKKGPRNKGPEW
jgi:hypothetical protein